MFASTLRAALNNLWPIIVIFCVVIILARIFYGFANGKKIVIHEELKNLILIVYLFLLFGMVTNNDQGNGGINLVPFTEIFRYDFGSRQFIYNVLGNVAVFVPFGYFMASYTKSKRLWHIFVITVLTSLTIELVQLNIGRAFDIDDIILNLIGGVFGYLIFIGFSAIAARLPKFLKSDWFLNILSILIIILVLLYVTNVFGYGWNF